jgi:hypothetical protein
MDTGKKPGPESWPDEPENPNRPQACSSCGATALEPGFIEDGGDHSRGYARWIAGPLQRGILGGARRMGKQRWQIEAYRCSLCGHLDLYVYNPV